MWSDDRSEWLVPDVARYLEREAEALVVGGYRGWLEFAVDPDVRKLEAVWNAFNRSLDRHCARLAMSGLETLIRRLGTCATCPLRFHCQGSSHLCRDECLVLGLVSGLQNGDEETAFLSAGALTSQARALERLRAGSEFAMAMKSGGKHLLPISGQTIRMIAASAPHSGNKTLH